MLNERIFVLGKEEITYTGIELRAEDDELVWLEILNLARRWTLNAWVEFTRYGFCKALAWPTSPVYYERLHASLLRLKATAVVIVPRSGERGVAVSMLDAYEWADGKGEALPRRRVRLNPAMSTLFANERFTRVQWPLYRALTPVARRLFDYAASHRVPHPVRLESLRLMCGSDVGTRVRRWRQTLLRALRELETGGLLSGEIRGDLVHLFRLQLSSVEVRSGLGHVVS